MYPVLAVSPPTDIQTKALPFGILRGGTYVASAARFHTLWQVATIATPRSNRTGHSRRKQENHEALSQRLHR